jgi:hypothetical protein
MFDHRPVALVLASGAPGLPQATIRWKCSDTPGGTIAIVSASTVGLPGGSRKPSLAR